MNISFPNKQEIFLILIGGSGMFGINSFNGIEQSINGTIVGLVAYILLYLIYFKKIKSRDDLTKSCEGADRP
jgi:purine-cytosine permease-like protein